VKVVVIVQIGNASQIPYGKKRLFGSLAIAPDGKRKQLPERLVRNGYIWEVS